MIIPQKSPEGIDDELAELRSMPWTLTVYPEAREAGGAQRMALVERAAIGQWISHQPQAPDRAAEEAARRARSTLRRYIVTNRLDRLGTLTYAGKGQHDPLALREDVAGFWRRLRASSGVGAYVWVPEWHPKGHGLHVHFGVGKYVMRSLIEEAWGKDRGFVHIKQIKAKHEGIEGSRQVAAYLAKYLSKDLERLGGLHRYEVAQGFKPIAERILGTSSDDVLARAAAKYFGGVAPNHRWDSDGDFAIRTRAVWASWD